MVAPKKSRAVKIGQATQLERGRTSGRTLAGRDGPQHSAVLRVRDPQPGHVAVEGMCTGTVHWPVRVGDDQAELSGVGGPRSAAESMLTKGGLGVVRRRVGRNKWGNGGRIGAGLEGGCI